MCPASTKICKLCGVGFRGTTTPEEVHCAKCFVKTCDVPEDTDEQFLKLVSEIHGADMASTQKYPLSTATVLPMIKDILNHKVRLSKLEGDLEHSKKSTKEKNRAKREIYRLREEKREMETLLEGVKAKMMHFALMTSPLRTSTPATPKNKSVTDSPVKAFSFTTPSPKSPAPLKVPTNTPATITPTSPVSKSNKFAEIKNNTPLTTPTTPHTPQSPPRSPTKETPPTKEMPPTKETPPTSPTSAKPNASPVKLTALKFEAAAKKVNNVVTFAKVPSKPKPARAPEVNNNDTPVTASSSSGEEDDEFEQEIGNGNPSALTRSNSVRDRIKAFEEIQRRASTGSYDRKKSQQGKARRSLSTIKSINV